MTNHKLLEAAYRAKDEVNDQIDRFIELVESRTADASDFMSMCELEEMWRDLRMSTNRTYSDLVSETLSSVDTRDVDAAKKESSSGTGSA